VYYFKLFFGKIRIETNNGCSVRAQLKEANHNDTEPKPGLFESVVKYHILNGWCEILLVFVVALFQSGLLISQLLASSGPKSPVVSKFVANITLSVASVNYFIKLASLA